MSKASKHNILTSLITVIIFLVFSFVLSLAILPFTALFMKDILLLVGITTCTIGSLALMGESSSSQIINPFVRLTPIFVQECSEITKEDLDIQEATPHYVQHAVHHLRKSTFEFSLSGALLILVVIL